MRKRIVIAFLAVSLLVPQFMFISTAKEGADGAGSGDDAIVSAAPAESFVTEDIIEDDQEAAGDKKATEPSPQVKHTEQVENDVPVMEEGEENGETKAYTEVEPEVEKNQETEGDKGVKEPATQAEQIDQVESDVPVMKEGAENNLAVYAAESTGLTEEIATSGSYTDANGIEMFWRITADGTLIYSGSGTVEDTLTPPLVWVDLGSGKSCS